MPKIKAKCAHCGFEVEWYKSSLYEVGINELDGKYYCDQCIKKFALYYMRASEL